MLSREVMGVLALGILWVNTLLIAAAALQEARALLACRRALLRGQVLRGRVIRGAGPRGALARHCVEQVGRAAGAGEVIVFTDRGAAGEVHGGSVELATGGEVEVESCQPAEVWLSRAALDLAAAASAAAGDGFEDAYGASRKARGYLRAVDAPVPEGAEVFLCGSLVTRGETRVLGPPADGPLLVATLDPAALCLRNAALVLAAIAAFLAGAAGCTLLALHAPRFGTVSLVGAALGLGFFLLVQPLGTALRDAVRLPPRLAVGGVWARPSGTVAERPA